MFTKLFQDKAAFHDVRGIENLHMHVGRSFQASQKIQMWRFLSKCCDSWALTTFESMSLACSKFRCLCVFSRERANGSWLSTVETRCHCGACHQDLIVMKKAPGKSLDYVISEKWRTEALTIAGIFSPAG